jgi:two-component system, NarL family, response regulator DevR
MSEETRQDIRIMLVDDHSSFRQALAFTLEQEPDFKVVAQAGSLTEAREVVREAELALDVAVVDLELPDGSGVEFIDDLYELEPQVLTLVLSAYSDKELLAQAIEAGAAGVLHKSSRLKEIVNAVRRLEAGEQLLSQQEVIEAVRLVNRQRREDREAQLTIGKLTPREREVLRALAEGLSDKEIAECLYVGIGTVRTHITSILAKLGVQSRLQALVFAVRHGLVKVG